MKIAAAGITTRSARSESEGHARAALSDRPAHIPRQRLQSGSGAPPIEITRSGMRWQIRANGRSTAAYSAAGPVAESTVSSAIHAAITANDPRAAINAAQRLYAGVALTAEAGGWTPRSRPATRAAGGPSRTS